MKYQTKNFVTSLKLELTQFVFYVGPSVAKQFDRCY